MGPVKNQILQQIKPDFSPTIQPWRRLNTFHHLPIMSVTFFFPSSLWPGFKGNVHPRVHLVPTLWSIPVSQFGPRRAWIWQRPSDTIDPAPILIFPSNIDAVIPPSLAKRSRGFVGRRICVGGTQSLLDSCKLQRSDKNSHDEPSWLTDGKRKPSGAERANLPLLFTHRFSGLFRGATTLCKLVKKKRKQTSPPLGKILPIDFGAFFRARSA